MIKIESIIAKGPIVPNCEYYLGGIIQNTNRVVVMTLQKTPVPGNYDMTEVFGIEKQDLMDMILEESKEAGEAVFRTLKRKGL